MDVSLFFLSNLTNHKSQVKSHYFTELIWLLVMRMIGVRTESVNIISKPVRREAGDCHVWEHMSVMSVSTVRLDCRLSVSAVVA